MMSNWIVPRRAARLHAPGLLGPFWNLDRFFDDLCVIDRGVVSSRNPAFAPVMNIEETDEALRLSAELPGLAETDFEITTEADVLTIKGEKKVEAASNDGGRKRIERSCGSFERSFKLGWEIDPESVKASYKNGVLDLEIPKPEMEQPQVRTIPVTSS